jgi:small subunit ribosomal protein S8
MVDPIADFLTRIRNGQMARNSVVSAPYSKIKKSIADVMLKNKFLSSVEVDKTGKFPLLKVVVLDNKKVNLKRVSRCGQRIYSGGQTLRKVLNGLGISIVSTSKGVMTGYEARSKNIGGEILCEVY